MSNNKCKPITLTQPEAWTLAAKAQAKREGVSLSAWLGECLLANLDSDLRAGLDARRKQGRPVQGGAS